MKVSISTSNVEYIKKRIDKKLSKLKTDKFVTVGIHSDTGTHEKSELTNAALGATLHYGTDNAGRNHKVKIPPRPWLDVGVNSGKKEYSKLIKKDIKNKKPLSLVLDRLGLVAVGKVQEYMTNLNSPPNSQVTVSIKGFNNPLIWTGELKNSVSYKIVNNKPHEGI